MTALLSQRVWSWKSFFVFIPFQLLSCLFLYFGCSLFQFAPNWLLLWSCVCLYLANHTPTSLFHWPFCALKQQGEKCFGFEFNLRLTVSYMFMAWSKAIQWLILVNYAVEMLSCSILGSFLWQTCNLLKFYFVLII